jgi:hypothetical protein
LRDRTHLVDQLLGVERLIDEVIGAHGSAAGSVIRLMFAGEQNHARVGRFLFDLTAEVIAIGPFQTGVDESHLGLLGTHFAQCLLGAPGNHHSKIFPPESHFQDLSHGGAVVDG